jgi:hypothetical protein
VQASLGRPIWPLFALPSGAHFNVFRHFDFGTGFETFS